MLIDKTYFKGQLLIANLNEPDPDNITLSDLDDIIEQSEEEVLSFAFGVKMWLDFKKQYTKDPNNIPQNYKDILFGKHYTKTSNGQEVDLYWKGLTPLDRKESLLANYIYVVHQTENITQTTAFGQTKVDNKIGIQVPITSKITRIYNEFLELLQGGVRSDSAGYTHEGNPYWVVGNGGIDYFGIYHRKGFVSLMQFLYDNQKDYPLLDTNYKKIGVFHNEFGI